MKKISTLILLFFVGLTTQAQNYPVGHRSVTFTDNARNRAVPTDLYYPAAVSGDNTAVVAGTTAFPVVVFGHGFLIPGSAYQWLADSLVKQGFIVAFPNTEGGILPSHTNFGNDLYFLSTYITSLNDSASSFLYQRVIKKAAIGGHSMGGGASLLAVAGNKPAVDAVFNFSAAETNPSATAAAALDQKPALIFSGSQDCIAAPSVQLGMYNNIPACKTYINIAGATHCQFANNNFICAAGQLVSGCNSSPITASTVFNKTITLLVPFLNYYLKTDCASGDLFVNAYNTATDVTKQRSCAPFPSCGPLPVTLVSFTGQLSGSKVNLAWKTATEFNIKEFVVERSSDGITFSQLNTQSAQFNNGSGGDYTTFDNYPYSNYNFYRLKTVDKDGTVSYSATIKIKTAGKSNAITQLYPNPVSDVLHIQMQANSRLQVSFIIFDVAGKQVATQQNSLASGLNDLQINCNGLAKGTYILQARDANGNSIGNFKIVKN
ncbi:MAG: T9SS type A sorting domain-containing protein [Ferruginibacter sp.]